MDFEKIKETMTKEEFFKKEFYNNNGCPGHYDLKSRCDLSCKECWRNAIEKGNVKFKDDIQEIKPKEAIKALELVQRFCTNIGDCEGCPFDTEDGMCQVKKVGNNVPQYYELEKLEDMLNPIVKIYEIEHQKNGKLYEFISDEKLDVDNIVYCDTKYGNTYGKVINITNGKNDNHKKCWRVK